MTGLLARVASLVVEPSASAEPHTVAPAGARVLVLGSAADAPPFAAALAGALRARERAPAALVCLWAPATSAAATRGPSATGHSAIGHPGGPPSALWSAGGARRLAARLAARDLAVRAAGRMVWLALPEDPTEAARVLGRLIGWLDVPVVTALAGPRQAEHDALVADHDLVAAVRPAAGGPLSAGGAEALTALALERLDGWSLACDPLPSGPARWRARAGLARLPLDHPAVAAGPARKAAG
jgi:hypothetical protein